MASKTRSRSSAVKQEGLVVGPKSRFKSLDVALDKVEEGGTIYLRPGRYVLQGKIPHSVNIVGCPEENKPVELSIPKFNPLNVKGITLAVYGCSLSCCLRPYAWLSGHEDLGDRDIERLLSDPLISVTGSGAFVAENCVWGGFVTPCVWVTDGKATLVDCSTGWYRGAVLKITDNGEAEIRRCVFDSSSGDSIEFAGRNLLVKESSFHSYYDGLTLSSGNARFEQCVFERSDDYAMFAEKSAKVELVSCQFKNNGTGIYLEGQADVQATGCVFSQNENGIQVQEASALQVGTCEFLNNKKYDVHVNTTRTADLDSCKFDPNSPIGILVEDGNVRLIECIWSDGSTDAHSVLSEQLGWGDLEKEQEGTPVALRVSGSHAHLYAQGCNWYGLRSVEIYGRATATFFACSFQKIHHPATIRSAFARFRGCTWSGASFASLLVQGESEVDVVESIFSLCHVAIYTSGTSQIRMSSSTAKDVSDAAFVTTDKAQATYHKCSMQDITRVAVEAYVVSKVSLSECNFANAQMAFHGWHGATVSAEKCDFRELFTVPKGKKAPKKKASSGKRRVWDMTLLPEAANTIGERVSLKACRFPPFETIA